MRDVGRETHGPMQAAYRDWRMGSDKGLNLASRIRQAHIHWASDGVGAEAKRAIAHHRRLAESGQVDPSTAVERKSTAESVTQRGRVADGCT